MANATFCPVRFFKGHLLRIGNPMLIRENLVNRPANLLYPLAVRLLFFS